MSLCIINITSYYYYYYYILLNGWAILNKSLHDHHHTLIINIYVFKKKKDLFHVLPICNNGH